MSETTTAISFRRRPWKEGKRYIICIPSAIEEEIPQGRLRVTLEALNEEEEE